MGKISKGFTTFMVTALKVLLVCAVIGSIGFTFTIIDNFNISALIVLGIIVATIYLGYKLVKSDISDSNKIGIVLLWALIIRTLWLLNVNSIPNSDYQTMYSAAGNFLDGDNSMFWGNSYIARFPHLTIMVLYMALMRGIFPIENLLVMKGINLFCGVAVVLLIYLIVKKVFENKKYGLYSAIITAIFPPLVSYTAVFCTENIAMPFYLLSIYVFLLVMKDKQNWQLLSLCGIFLAIGNLFRMVALVVLVAYAIYIILYCRDKIIIKARNVLVIGAFYGIVVCSVSGYCKVWRLQNTHSGGAVNQE